MRREEIEEGKRRTPRSRSLCHRNFSGEDASTEGVGGGRRIRAHTKRNAVTRHGSWHHPATVLFKYYRRVEQKQSIAHEKVKGLTEAVCVVAGSFAGLLTFPSQFRRRSNGSRSAGWSTSDNAAINGERFRRMHEK